ncbi:hypothetical protein PR202_gb23195 [Eleusine coracana subsp. coracana]|uniref:Uncharacterized protein n=1 Tax=Eleusine coracana subsp. coracana TaxID=191504 RepID=A0AAV5FIU2_ELECO|nr:hypothetical protein QOZ80_6BG0481220 [Eleusine coracana subsp. coracana]GJN34527.1 hypothetical protein PR202_gb23195 [Eleusine coracana subsp. coracana]
MASCHQQLRSTSLPVRPHALVQELEDELHRLRSNATSSSSSSSPATSSSLADRLADAYGRVEELVGLPGGRDALSTPRWRGAVEATLESSVSLLDLCERARDAAASAKQHVRAAQRAVRRGDAAAAKAAVRGYVRCLTKASKECTIHSKKVRATTATAAAETAAPAAVRVLAECVAVTVAVLRRVTSSLSASVEETSTATSKKSKWCVVSRLLRSDDRSLFDYLDTADDGLVRAQEMLQDLDDSVESVENALEHLFRRIVHSRVALLNVLTL